MFKMILLSMSLMGFVASSQKAEAVDVSAVPAIAHYGVATSLHSFNPIYHSGIRYGYGWYPHWSSVYHNPGFVYPGYSYWRYYNYRPYYATYGAIAFSEKTRRVGYSWGRRSLRSAKIASVDFCGADDCKSVVWVQGGCAAIAISEAALSEPIEEGGAANLSLSWGYATSKYKTRRYAMRACKQGAKVGCKIVAWTCSY